MRRASAVNDLIGAVKETLKALQNLRSLRLNQARPRPFLFQAAMAPSERLRAVSGMTRDSSISRSVPRPWQVGQAPLGELKEKRRGESSSRAYSGWSGSANLVEKEVSSQEERGLKGEGREESE